MGRMDIAEEDAGKAQRAIQSVEVGGRLLLALAEHLAPMTLKDLAAMAGLPPSRAHPYLVSYGRLGLVQQDGASGRYALGPAALQLGLAALHQCDPVRMAEPVADALAEETGQAVALAVWSNFGPTVIRMVDARQPLHVAMRAGTVMSIFGTATGRAFAGVLSRARVAAAMTAAALGDPAAGSARAVRAELDAQLASAQAELASHGCTRAVGRPIPGVNAFSAPVFDHDGEPAVVITLLGHQDHMPSAWSSALAATLKRAAGQLSAQLGHRP
jgi:DNA-binding IclR family transcriptional regulator